MNEAGLRSLVRGMIVEALAEETRVKIPVEVSLDSASDSGDLGASGGAWIELEQTGPGKWSIVDENFTDDQSPVVCFSDWSADAEDADAGSSDASQCFGLSEKLRVGDVEFDLESNVIAAPDVESIRAAIGSVVFCAWDPEDA